MTLEEKKSAFMMMLNERIRMSSSLSTNSAYHIVKQSFENIFGKSEPEKRLFTLEELETICRDAVSENMFLLHDEHDGWGEIDEARFKEWFTKTTKDKT